MRVKVDAGRHLASRHSRHQPDVMVGLARSVTSWWWGRGSGSEGVIATPPALAVGGGLLAAVAAVHR